MRTTIVSFSELDTYRQCPLKHLFAYKERWTKPLDPSDKRSKGTLWHLVMEVHYRTLQQLQQHEPELLRTNPLAALRRCRDNVDPVLQAHADDETRELIDWMYEGYVDAHGVDPQWRIDAVELQWLTPLLTPTGRKSRFVLKSRVDLLVTDFVTATPWVVDHKSGQNLPKELDLEIDDQFGLYTWAARQQGWRVAGAIHNAARTTRNQADYPTYSGKSRPQTLEQRFSRTYLNRADAELHNLAIDAYNASINAYPPQSKVLPLYSSPDPRQCGWKCDYKEVHLAMRAGIEPHRALVDFGFEQDFTRH